jgi:hypothetical protein
MTDRAPDSGQIAQRLGAAHRGEKRRAVHGRPQQRAGKAVFEPRSEADTDGIARCVERGKEKDCQHRHRGDRNQRLDVLGREHRCTWTPCRGC